MLKNLVLVDAADLDEIYEPVPYTAGSNDGEVIPHEVVDISFDKGISIRAAWRVYRRMSQAEVAAALGITQAAVSQIEKAEAPQKATLEKLANLYNCRVTQLLVA